MKNRIEKKSKTETEKAKPRLTSPKPEPAAGAAFEYILSRLRYYVALSVLRFGHCLSLAGAVLEEIGKPVRKFALRLGGVDDAAAKRERDAEWQKNLAEIKATPPDRYTVDLTTWKGYDGSPVELLEITPDHLSALRYTANAKRMTVETLLGEVVRKAVSV